MNIRIAVLLFVQLCFCANLAGHANLLENAGAKKLDDPTETPTLPTSNLTFSSVGATQLILGFQRGDGNGVLIVVSENEPPDMVPMDNATYYPGQLVGNGRVVSSDDAIDVFVPDLLPGTLYYFTAFEYNVFEELTSYLVEGAPVASQLTLLLPNVYVTSPANGAVGRPIALAVTARAVTGATTYEIELNEEPDFSGTSLIMSGARTQNFTLSYAKTYYTRVRTDLSADYGAVTSFSTLFPDIRVTSPANGAIDRPTTLNITAGALAGATAYTIEVSETSDFSDGVIVQSGARTQSFAGLKYGQQYFTRVKTDVYPVYGGVTTFNTIIPPVYVTAPVDGDVNKNVSLSISAREIAGAAAYTIELNTASDFSGTSIVQTGLRTQSFSGLAYETTYYARVRTDLSPVYGKTTSFTTGAPANFAYVTSPANLAINVSTSTFVTSNVVVGASMYTIQLSTSPEFATVDFESTGTFLTHSFAGLAYGTTYYTRVTTDLSASPGQVRSFTTRTAASLSYVVSPANGATAVNVNSTLSVRSNVVPGASLYTIQLSTDPNFEGTPLVGSSISTTVVFAGLEYNTTYYSRVGTNLTTEWGAVRSFTTGNPSLNSYLTSPANGAVDAKWFGTITLNSVPGAVVYTVELNTAADFTGTSIVRVGSRTPTVTLAEDQLYYVRVMTDLYPDWGPTRSFTTGNAVSLAYVVTPVSGSSGVPTTVTVYANSLPGATSYTIELNTDENFMGVPYEQTSISRAISFSGLDAGTTYYTRVKTSLAPAEWGPTKSFTTVSPGARTSSNWMGDEVDQVEIVETEPLNVVLFQNPITDKLSFLVEAPMVEDAAISLTDLAGRTIHRSMEKTNSVIDIYPTASPGILLLQVKTSRNAKVTKVLKIE